MSPPIREVAEHLKCQWPVAVLELPHDSPYGLLVSLVIAIQATEARAAVVAPKFLARYVDVKTLSTASVNDVAVALAGLPLANRKAATLVAVAARIVEEFDGNVPTNARQLENLPGIGPKTAAVIAGEYGDPTAFPAERHLLRVAARLHYEPARLFAETRPIDRYQLALRLTLHGRHCCTQRRPSCSSCMLQSTCPSVIRPTSG